MDDIPFPIPAGTQRFADEVRADMRARGYACPTERTYLHWIKRYIRFSGRRHPKDMGKADIEAFLNHLAVAATVSPSIQRTVLNALMYLYVKYYGREPEALSIHYAKPTWRLPTVLTDQEAKEILRYMSGTPRPITELLYGSGLRLQECLNLRIKDIDFALNTITVRIKGDSSLNSKAFLLSKLSPDVHLSRRWHPVVIDRLSRTDYFHDSM